jgi:hypothetical protein
VKANRKQDRHLNREHRQKPFAGVDGEGGNDDAGNHHYYILRAGSAVLENDDASPLTAEQILGFLADLDKSYLYVSYYYDYDVTMSLRGIAWDRVVRMLDMDCRQIPGKPCSRFPVDWNGFQFDYLPHKEFRVRKRIGTKLERRDDGTVRRRWVYSPWTIISDVGTFFQRKFCTADPEKPGALDLWFPEPEYAPMLRKIAEGKNQRETFTFVTEDERLYNEAECIMLARLMERFREMCERNGLRPQLYQGPGHLVSAALKGKIPKNSALEEFWGTDHALMANAGYYGGRFEACQFGEIPGPVYQYDINSAYANTYDRLPCLLHGEWERVTSMPTEGIFVGEVSFRHKEGLNVNTLPVRTKEGILVFPREATGVYWSPELQVASRYGDVHFHTGYRYIPGCDCVMFDFVRDLYKERKRLGKDTAGLVLKTLLASIYGKLAQSIGCAPYSNPVWAGLITAHTRATLVEGALAGGYGDDVVALATDGIFCRSPRALPIGGELGQWSETIHSSMFSVQSGIYFLPGATETKHKTRGTSQKIIAKHEDEFRQVWQEFVDHGILRPVVVEINQFIGLSLANARNKPHTAGQWVRSPKSIVFDFLSKRTNLMRDMRGTVLHTEPLPGSPSLYSAPYERAIGGFLAQVRDEMSEQPEWGPALW